MGLSDADFPEHPNARQRPQCPPMAKLRTSLVASRWAKTVRSPAAPAPTAAILPCRGRRHAEEGDNDRSLDAALCCVQPNGKGTPVSGPWAPDAMGQMRKVRQMLDRGFRLVAAPHPASPPSPREKSGEKAIHLPSPRTYGEKVPEGRMRGSNTKNFRHELRQLRLTRVAISNVLACPLHQLRT